MNHKAEVPTRTDKRLKAKTGLAARQKKSRSRKKEYI